MRVRLTQRGRAVVAVCVGGIVLAWLFGARSLNAVVAPGLVALGAAYFQLRRLDIPTVDRRLPADDFAGTTHTVQLDFRDSDRIAADLDTPFVADVRDELGPGLGGPDDPIRASIGATPVTYEVTYEARGRHEFGPATLTAVDVFGLAKRDLLVRGTDAAIVFPTRRSVPVWFRRELYHDETVGSSRQRDEFECLREYERGDALRDVHWPATAKRDELVVKEFVAEADQRHVHVSGGARGDVADDLAEATTSIALALLDDGIPVTVSVPNGTVDVRPGFDERRPLLELLAFATRGSIPDPGADVVVDADSIGTTVELDGGDIRFADLTAEAPTSAGGSAAELDADRWSSRTTTDDDSRTATDEASRTATDGGRSIDAGGHPSGGSDSGGDPP